MGYNFCNKRPLFKYCRTKKKFKKKLKHLWEAKVTLYLEDKSHEIALKKIDLSEILICSVVNFSTKFDDSFTTCPDNMKIKMKVEVNNGEKCVRCWKIFFVI